MSPTYALSNRCKLNVSTLLVKCLKISDHATRVQLQLVYLRLNIQNVFQVLWGHMPVISAAFVQLKDGTNLTSFIKLEQSNNFKFQFIVG